MSVKPATKKDITMVSSYGHAVILGGKPMIIGERINPTGKKKFKQALKDHDMDYILKEGITQQDKGAHILDVNVGLPDIDEPAMMKEVIMELQSVSSLPLQIDTVDITAMEAAMRIYNGKPMVNSVNGKQEIMDAAFPLIKRLRRCCDRAYDRRGWNSGNGRWKSPCGRKDHRRSEKIWH